jgi:hypothetical protein
MIVPVLATVVDVNALAQSMAAALIAGLSVTLAFSLSIFGATRYADLRRDGRGVAALGAALLAGLALLGSIAAVVFGLIVMVS